MRGGGDKSEPAMRVLGVDPGSAVTGWGVVERGGGGGGGGGVHGVVRAPARMPRAGRLAAVHTVLTEVCAHWQPHVLALETSFVGRNVQSAFRLGEVRGVALLAAVSAGVGIAEYSPATVKLAVTGHGAADKIQIGRAVSIELRLAAELPADAADALAIALCHLHSSGLRSLIAAQEAHATPGTVRA